MGNVWGQLFPPKPHFTESEVPSLEGKVFMVTGGNSGVGLEIVKILYARGATVYMAGRSATKINAEIEAIKAATPNSAGHLKNLVFDLSDLTTIKPAVNAFLAQESRLDVLFNNAELQPGKHHADMNRNYSASKAGNWFLASELDKRTPDVVSVVQSPGTLKTKGWDGTPKIVRIMMAPLFYPPKFGAYTGLWACLSLDVKKGDGQKFINPWGRWHETPKKEVVASLSPKEAGGTGLAAEFFEYCDEQTKEFAA